MLDIKLNLFDSSESDSSNSIAYGQSTSFVETTLARFKDKLAAGKGSLIYPNPNKIYFVSTNFSKDKNWGTPYLLYKGDQMIGNSSVIEIRAVNNLVACTGSSMFSAKNAYRLEPYTDSQTIDGEKTYKITLDSQYSEFNLEDIVLYNEFTIVNEFENTYSQQLDCYIVDKNSYDEINKFYNICKVVVTEFNDAYEYSYVNIGKLYVDNRTVVIDSVVDSTDEEINIGTLYAGNIYNIYLASPITPDSLRLHFKDISNGNKVYTFSDFREQPTDSEGKIYLKSDLDSGKVNKVQFGKINYENGLITIYNNRYSVNSGTPNLYSFGCAIEGKNSVISIEYNYNVNIDNIQQLSEVIPGMPGQTLFVINRFIGRNGQESCGTTMFYWDSDADGGNWKNANLTYTSTLNLPDGLSFSDEELIKLKQLLQ